MFGLLAVCFKKWIGDHFMGISVQLDFCPTLHILAMRSTFVETCQYWLKSSHRSMHRSVVQLSHWLRSISVVYWMVPDVPNHGSNALESPANTREKKQLLGHIKLGNTDIRLEIEWTELNQPVIMYCHR